MEHPPREDGDCSRHGYEEVLSDQKLLPSCGPTSTLPHHLTRQRGSWWAAAATGGPAIGFGWF